MVAMVIDNVDYVVVWSGRDPLIPDREEQRDNRYAGMPSYDIDDGQQVVQRPVRRKYTKTGRYTKKHPSHDGMDTVSLPAGVCPEGEGEQ